jgi:hypothetical protein
MGQLPNWLVILFAIVLTLITGAECTALLMHGWFMVDDPDALRDGQYMFVFFLGGSAGTAAVIPTAVMGAVMVARRPDFVRYLTVTLALITALGVGMGLLLSVPAGINGVGWGVLGIGLTLLGIITTPLGLFWFGHCAPVAVPIGVLMALAVIGAYWIYNRREGGTASV